MNKVKYKCFGKVTISSKSKCDKRLEHLQKQKQTVADNNGKDKDDIIKSIDEEMIRVMKEIQKVDYERQLNSRQDIAKKKGKSAAVFNLRDRILGGRKACQEQVALIDPASGNEVTTPAEIKKGLTLILCQSLEEKDSQK